jgi:hypothetical protein
MAFFSNYRWVNVVISQISCCPSHEILIRDRKHSPEINRSTKNARKPRQICNTHGGFWWSGIPYGSGVGRLRFRFYFRWRTQPRAECRSGLSKNGSPSLVAMYRDPAWLSYFLFSDLKELLFCRFRIPYSS